MSLRRNYSRILWEILSKIIILVETSMVGSLVNLKGFGRKR